MIRSNFKTLDLVGKDIKINSEISNGLSLRKTVDELVNFFNITKLKKMSFQFRKIGKILQLQKRAQKASRSFYSSKESSLKILTEWVLLF